MWKTVRGPAAWPQKKGWLIISSAVLVDLNSYHSTVALSRK